MPKPPKDTSLPSLKAPRANRVALGLVNGKSKKALASDLGVSRKTISRDAQAPETRQLILDYIQEHRAEADAMFTECFAAIREALAATKTVAVRVVVTSRTNATDKKETSAALELGPDHYARLAAARRFLEFIVAGRAAAKEVEQKPRGITWPELQELIAKAKGEKYAVAPGTDA